MRSVSPWASRVSPRWVSSTASSPTVPSWSSAGRPPPSSAAIDDLRGGGPPPPHLVANAARRGGAGPGARGAGRGGAGLRAFVPEPHRIAEVATVDGVRFVDDSKATNPHAARASLTAYEHVVWVAGGLLKGADVDDLVVGAASRLRGVVLIGRDRAARRALARHAPDVPVVDVDRTDTGAMDLVREARARARGGRRPAGRPRHPWTFTDYGARGDAFVGAVRRLAAGE